MVLLGLRLACNCTCRFVILCWFFVLCELFPCFVCTPAASLCCRLCCFSMLHFGWWHRSFCLVPTIH
jgi:hypothetical protein